MKCFLDTFSGLVPCIAVSKRVTQYDGLEITVKLTATRGAYKRGETVAMTHRHVVPRGQVYRSRQRCGQSMIRSYSIEAFDGVAELPAAKGLDL